MSARELLATVHRVLDETSNKSLRLPSDNIKGKKVQQTIGKFYRGWSALSVHILDVSNDTLFKQFKSLLSELAYFKDNKNLDEICKILAIKFNNEAIKLAHQRSISNSNYKYYIDIEGDDLHFISNSKIDYITGKSLDVFSEVRKFVTEITGGKSYDFREFIYNTLKNTQFKDDSIKNLDLTIINTKGEQSTLKFGFDIGHVTSNVVSAIGAITVNALRRMPNSEEYLSRLISKDTEGKLAVSEEITELYNSLINDPIGGMSLMGIDDEELYKECVTATVGTLKRLVNNELHIVMNVKKEPVLDKKTIQRIAALMIDRVMPEAAPKNQKDGAKLEAAIGRELSKGGRFLTAFKGLTDGSINLMQLSSSDKGIDILKNHLMATLTGKSYKYTSSTSVIVKPNSKTQIPNNNIKKSKIGSKSATTLNKLPVPSLRNLKGQFTSLTSLESLMRSQLQQTILKNMQRPNLRERTGRFRKSVELKGLSRLRDGSIQAFLTYMRYPYGTFELGGRQGNKGYSPTRLIDQSVREVAAKLVKERMKVIVQ